MIKILLLVLLSISLSGCDRDALQGLNLKINTEIKSDYDHEDKQKEK